MRYFAAALFFFFALNASAAPIVLYDATLGNTPAQQSWLGAGDGSFQIPFHNGAGTVMDTTADSDARFGYFSEDPLFGTAQHPQLPTLSRQQGFEVSFSLQVLDENHALRDDNGDGKYDRAGFSLIVISNDLAGIEIGFFEDKIWAYEDGLSNAANLFTQAESVGLDTTQFNDYTLRGTNTGYSLFLNGTSILSGDWRTYNTNTLFPYDNPSSLFFGDNTTSASSHVVLGSINVESGPFPPPTPVPLPPAAILILAGSVMLRAARRVR